MTRDLEHTKHLVSFCFYRLQRTTLSNMDKNSSYLAFARNCHGPCSRKSRTGGRECTPMATTYSPSETDQTSNMYEKGSTPTGASG